MKLLERLAEKTSQTAPSSQNGISAQRKGKDGVADGFRQLKLKAHSRLFETMDLAQLENVDPALLSAKVTATISDLLKEEARLLTDSDRARLVDELKDELLGLGPLEPLLRDDSITDILVNGYDHVYVEKKGKLHRTEAAFQDDQHLMLIIDRIVSKVGRRVDEASPMVDARLPDGSRINAIIPPLAIDGPSLSVRRFGKYRFRIEDLIAKEAMTPEMADLLAAIARARLNVMVCGGTGSGKTTLLNCLSSFIPEDERIVTIEDSAELMLQQPHVVRLETRPPNLEGKGEVTQRDLVRNCLRMRPDRIIVGEVRGPEVIDMLQAMSTGHDGSIATVHANSTRECLSRLEMMMLLAGYSIPQRAMRQQISSAINIIVHVTRFADGSRKVAKISEISGMEGDVVMMQDLFDFVQSGVSATGKVQGSFRATGIRSSYAAKIEAAGGRLDMRQPRSAAAE
ncbi:MAG: TadA family conjugal transfer-associated ATPase [Candidatus Binatales bacterium]